ncbi:MAG: COP23 domain-containing protein [Nostoc sp.]|uniref:COP23 domain-containing protein n=1 Tax=Nostoc sp. TaxID=1180 RepID=UPI002FF7B566
MILKLFAKEFPVAAVSIASLTAFIITATSDQPSYAQSTNFSCDVNKDGVPTTYVLRKQGGKIPVISWISSEFPPPWTPMQRCLEVSERLQKNYDNGTLKILKVGSFNKQTVLCAAMNTSDPCTNNTLLFTFKPGSKPEETLERILDPRGIEAGKILNQSGDDSAIAINLKLYLDSTALK